MSVLVVAAAVISLIWIVLFLVSRWLGERYAKKFEISLLLLLCAVLGAGIYIIYIAEDGAAIVFGLMEFGGFIGGILKLVLAVGMLWCVGDV